MPVIRECSQRDGIVVFDSALDHQSTYDARHLETLREAEANHFWFSARRERICQTFQHYIDKKSSILEIGGGTGFVAEKLIQMGFSVAMADIHQNGLKFAKERGIEKLYQFDLFYPPFQHEFDVICLFDVLEHLEDEKKALECIKTMLKPGGKIILTVPAHRWLWSRDDAIAGHKKRYTKKDLEEVFLNCSLQPLYLHYFFISILPLLILRKLIKKDIRTSVKQDECVQFSIHPFLNQALRLLTKAEFKMEKYLPNRMGGSLLAVAQSTLDVAIDTTRVKKEDGL